MAFGGACLGHNMTGRSTGLVVAFSTWLGGLATLLEKKSRRLELALYVLSRWGALSLKLSKGMMGFVVHVSWCICDSQWHCLLCVVCL
jgi:hypothetical protein